MKTLLLFMTFVNRMVNEHMQLVWKYPLTMALHCYAFVFIMKFIIGILHILSTTGMVLFTSLLCDYTGCFIICVTIKNCYGFFEYAKIYKRLTQPCSRHSKVLFNV